MTHGASLTHIVDRFQIGLFADNIFDGYAVTAIGNDISSFNQVPTDEPRGERGAPLGAAIVSGRSYRGAATAAPYPSITASRSSTLPVAKAVYSSPTA